MLKFVFFLSVYYLRYVQVNEYNKISTIDITHENELSPLVFKYNLKLLYIYIEHPFLLVMFFIVVHI